MDVRGGGTGTREIESLSPLANAEGPTAVLLTGGSAFGLAAADGVARWLEERGLGRPTPMGWSRSCPPRSCTTSRRAKPAAVPDPTKATPRVTAPGEAIPRAWPVGAGAGAAVGKLFGRERSTRGGVGYAATRLGDGTIRRRGRRRQRLRRRHRRGREAARRAARRERPARPHRPPCSRRWPAPPGARRSLPPPPETPRLRACSPTPRSTSAVARSSRGWRAPASRARSTRSSPLSTGTLCSAWRRGPSRRAPPALRRHGRSRCSVRRGDRHRRGDPGRRPAGRLTARAPANHLTVD